MKDTFAKIFEFEDCQILIIKDTDEDTPILKQMTSIEDYNPQLKLAYKEEKRRDAAFEKYGKDQAEIFMKIVKNFIFGEGEKKDGN